MPGDVSSVWGYAWRVAEATHRPALAHASPEVVPCAVCLRKAPCAASESGWRGDGAVGRNDDYDDRAGDRGDCNFEDGGRGILPFSGNRWCLQFVMSPRRGRGAGMGSRASRFINRHVRRHRTGSLRPGGGVRSNLAVRAIQSPLLWRNIPASRLSGCAWSSDITVARRASNERGNRLHFRPAAAPFPRGFLSNQGKSRDLLRVPSTTLNIYKQEPSMFTPPRRRPLPPCPPQRPLRTSWSLEVAVLASPSPSPSQRSWITLSTTSSSSTCVPA